MGDQVRLGVVASVGRRVELATRVARESPSHVTKNVTAAPYRAWTSRSPNQASIAPNARHGPGRIGYHVHMGMEWNRLLPRERVNHQLGVREIDPEQDRSAFERDWDRIIFSTAFRRMHDKTQLFPLPDDDVVHSRLTHSLEVSSVGRSLGKRAGQTICQRHSIGENLFDHHDVGMVVATACLAHDMGNPPFGHAGENAIASYFQSERALRALEGLTPQQLADLKNFEGNAQGFRILTRLQLEADKGLRLTAATLAAFCKYPRVSGDGLADGDNVATKKHGCVQHDQEILCTVAEHLGLVPLKPKLAWARHPLAFLVEAADDICYSILDIEDAVRLGHVPLKEAADHLEPIARKLNTYNVGRYLSFLDRDTRLEYLRAMAIGQMIDECVEVFLDDEPLILKGAFQCPLAAKIPSHAELEALKGLAKQRCYGVAEVLEIELAGYEALGGLLEHFVPAVIPDPSDRKQQAGRDRKSLELLRHHGVDVDASTLYERVLRVTDFVSGMTDRGALGTYRRLKGIAIPGRIV